MLFAIIDVVALALLVASGVTTILLLNLMGRGKDTGPVQLLFVVIVVNIILGVSLLLAMYMKYLGAYLNYIRITDIALLLIGAILAASVFKIYKDYEKLVKKHEPDN